MPEPVGFPITAYSWSMSSPNHAVKTTDKSCFRYQGTGIPVVLYPFFCINQGLVRSSLPVRIIFQGTSYQAYCSRDRQNRWRLFFRAGFGDVLCNACPEWNSAFQTEDAPEGSPPLLDFKRVGTTVNDYEVSIIYRGPVLQSGVVKKFAEDSEGFHSWQHANNHGFFADILADGGSNIVMHKASHNISKASTQTNKQIHSGHIVVSDNLQKLVAVLIASGHKPEAFKNCEVCNINISEQPVIFNATTDPEMLTKATKSLLSTGLALDKPEGIVTPQFNSRQSYEYCRSPQVKAWVLQQACGKCELCKMDAPFIDKQGIPFLEVHHIVTLANGGPDIVENCVALCPNCHRKTHHGQEVDQLVAKLKLVGTNRINTAFGL